MIRAWLVILFFIAPLLADIIEFTGYWFGDIYENKVTNSGFVLQKDLPAKTSLTFDIELDQVLQPPIVVGQTRTIDGVSGASRPGRLAWESSATRQLNRGQIILGLDKMFGQNTTLGINLYTSQEIDYDSKAVSARIQQELFQKNFTINLSGQYTLDSVGFLNNAGLNYQKKESQRGDLSVRQLLSPSAYISAGLYSEIQRGLLSNPYRIFSVDTTAGDTLYERHPNYRFRYAGWITLAKMFPDIRGSVIGTYRQYRDDWNMVSHTLLIKLNQYITSNFIFSPTIRHYRQTGTDFFENGGTADYFTHDEKLSTLQANSFGLGGTWILKGIAKTFKDLEFLRHASLYLGYTRYFNDLDYTSNLVDFRTRFEF